MDDQNDDNDHNDQSLGSLPAELPDELPQEVADDAPKLLDPDEDLDVTEPASDGEPIHRSAGGDVGEGAD